MATLSESDRQFLAAFDACEIGAADFGHREHLRLAYIQLTLHPFDTALANVEAGLRRLLAHLGAPASKYHETLTRAWMLAVHHFMHRAGPTRSFDEFLQTASPLLDARIMETHYTRERLWAEEARVRFIAPDLQPIPTHAA